MGALTMNVFVQTISFGLRPNHYYQDYANSLTNNVNPQITMYKSCLFMMPHFLCSIYYLCPFCDIKAQSILYQIMSSFWLKLSPSTLRVQILRLLCLRLIPYCSQPAKRARYYKDLAFTASDTQAYLTAVDIHLLRNGHEHIVS